MTAAQTLDVVYGLVQNMRVVLDGEQNTLVLSLAGCKGNLPSRRQGIDRPCYGSPQYVFPATVKRHHV